jgi:hypothetical protein
MRTIFRILAILCFIFAVVIWLGQPGIDIYKNSGNWLIAIGISGASRLFIGCLLIIGFVVIGVWLWMLGKKKKQ